MLLKDTSRSMAGPRARGHVTSRDQRLAVDMWDPVGPERGAAVLFHGYGAYSRYPTVLWAAEVLAECGLRCYAADMAGIRSVF